VVKWSHPQHFITYLLQHLPSFHANALHSSLETVSVLEPSLDPMCLIEKVIVSAQGMVDTLSPFTQTPLSAVSHPTARGINVLSEETLSNPVSPTQKNPRFKSTISPQQPFSRSSSLTPRSPPQYCLACVTLALAADVSWNSLSETTLSDLKHFRFDCPLRRRRDEPPHETPGC